MYEIYQETICVNYKTNKFYILKFMLFCYGNMFLYNCAIHRPVIYVMPSSDENRTKIEMILKLRWMLQSH